MKAALRLLAVLLFVSPSIAYFKYQRQIQAPNSRGQHYAVVDETLWSHARPDLNDLRLYAGESEIPYALAVERGSSEVAEKTVRVLQPATLGGKTQFVLDTSEVPEYDRVELQLSTRNFVAHARVDGQDNLHGKQWADLGTTTLYDLSGEKLGANRTLHLPLTTYKYLRVTIDGSVRPFEVRSATAGVKQEERAIWRKVNSESKQEQQGKDTVLTFRFRSNAPVERLDFAIDPVQPNCRRDLEIRGGKGEWLGSGEISRIHMYRHRQKIDVEQTTVYLHFARPETLRVIIHNGDDPPLKITSAQLQQYERRIYFDSAPGVEPTLYYGDEMLGAPVFDYSKLFQKNAEAYQALLGAEETNSAYTGRPDRRPWSERHPVVLWVAILGAVLVLGGIALRSMRALAG
jgi:hypothetical protein